MASTHFWIRAPVATKHKPAAILLPNFRFRWGDYCPIFINRVSLVSLRGLVWNAVIKVGRYIHGRGAPKRILERRHADSVIQGREQQHRPCRDGCLRERECRSIMLWSSTNFEVSSTASLLSALQTTTRDPTLPSRPCVLPITVPRIVLSWYSIPFTVPTRKREPTRYIPTVETQRFSLMLCCILHGLETLICTYNQK